MSSAASPLRGKEEKRRRKVISMEVKQEIVERSEAGTSTKVLSEVFGMAPSTVSTILKQKEEIKRVKLIATTRLVKGRDTIAHTERLLEAWIKERQMGGHTLSQALICAKAKAIFDELKASSSAAAGTATTTKYHEFHASRGWFEKFKRRGERRSLLHLGALPPRRRLQGSLQEESNGDVQSKKTPPAEDDDDGTETSCSGAFVVHGGDFEPIKIKEEAVESSSGMRESPSHEGGDPLSAAEVTLSKTADCDDTGSQMTDCNDDDHDVYGEYIAREIRKLSQRSQSVAKHLISNVIFDAQMGEFEKDPVVGPPPTCCRYYRSLSSSSNDGRPSSEH